MKHSAIYILMIICLCGYSFHAQAAFPNMSKQTGVAATGKIEKLPVAIAGIETIHNNKNNSTPLINPEHVLGDVLSISSLVLGVLGLIISISSGFGLVLGLLAIITGVAAIHMEGIKRFATWGLVLGSIAVVVALLIAYVSL